jgi:hypothetical protein
MSLTGKIFQTTQNSSAGFLMGFVCPSKFGKDVREIGLGLANGSGIKMAQQIKQGYRHARTDAGQAPAGFFPY